MAPAMRRILVVDADRDLRDALELTLSRMGHGVELAKNGEQALKVLSSEEYSMMVTDVRMPKMGGIDLLKHARESCPEMPVLVITGYGTINNAVKAMKHGAADYIVKPFPAQTLEQAVKDNLIDANDLDTGEPGIDKHAIVARDSNMKKLIKIAKNVSRSDATILISGESGTGKEVLARYIHRQSRRAKAPFIAFNCAAMPETLMESELFGHEKGSFTGAHMKRKGKFELANRGTILLDEISEMDVALQAKLLRVIQEREIDRIGSDGPIPVDVRIIATTNADLKKRVQQGAFREDLFFRLAVIPLALPPLRERPSDIEALVDHFVPLFGKKHGKKIGGVSENTMKLLKDYNWLGNVRELSNTIERAVLMAPGSILEAQDLFSHDLSLNSTLCAGMGLYSEPESDKTGEETSKIGRRQNIDISMDANRDEKGLKNLRQMEMQHIIKVLENEKNNRTKAAKVLGISIRTLRNKIKQYSLSM